MSHYLFLISFIISFLLVIVCIPAIVRVASQKHLFDKQDDRKIHTQVVPALGGVAIFIGFIVSTIVSTGSYYFAELKFLIASIILVFFIGLKDDLIVVSNRKKFMIQLFAVLLIIFMANFRLSHFHGFLGFHQVNYVTGTFATLFLMLLTINAYNLIDGIDGLASGLAIMASFIFGIWFIFAKDYHFAILSLALAGSLSGFFIYNVFGTKNKLFMGDAGSLVVGMTISAILVRFNEIDSATNLPYFAQNAPALSFALVLVPLVDTLRVFSIRIRYGKSPFAPDNNHVHHRLLKIFGNHLTVSAIIIAVNLLFVCLALGLNALGTDVNLQFLILILLALIASYIPMLVLKKKVKKDHSAASGMVASV